MSRGERVTLLSAFALAGEIILIGHYAGKVAARRVTTLQLLAAALFTLCAMRSSCGARAKKVQT